MTINPYSIPPLLCSLIAISLGIFVLLKNPRAAVNRSFFLLCVTVVSWLSFYAVLYNFDLNQPWVLSWFRISYCGITFISIMCFQYIQDFFRFKNLRRWNLCVYSWGIICSYLIIKTDFIIKGLYHFYWGPYPKAGLLHPLFLSTFTAIIFTGFIFILREAQSKKNNLLRVNQAKYLLMAYTIFCFASLDFVPNYGIELYPIGYVPTAIFLLIIAYAIIKHQLMDITIVFRTGIVYSFLITVITLVYLIMIFVIERIFHDLLRYQSFFISVLTAIAIAVFFIPLKNRIQRLVDRYFFKGTNVEIAKQNELLRKELTQAEKMKAVATLASGMAHEIKNPITVIKTFTEFLPERKNDPHFIDSFQKNVGNEIVRMDNLVRQLLDFARPAPLEIKSIKIHSLLEETLQLLQNKFSQNKIQLIQEYSVRPIELSLDPNQFKQALLNIFLNSIDAMPDGGILTIRTYLELPSTSSNRDPKNFTMTITDTGCGITSKDLPTIFDPFITKKSNGTGLGLTITQTIIQEHKGTIRIESTGLGQGSRVIINVPISSEKQGNND